MVTCTRRVNCCRKYNYGTRLVSPQRQEPHLYFAFITTSTHDNKTYRVAEKAKLVCVRIECFRANYDLAGEMQFATKVAIRADVSYRAYEQFTTQHQSSQHKALGDFRKRLPSHPDLQSKLKFIAIAVRLRRSLDRLCWLSKAFSCSEYCDGHLHSKRYVKCFLFANLLSITISAKQKLKKELIKSMT